jgi:integrase
MGLTITEMIAAYFRHAETYYRDPEGKPSLELLNIKYALRPVRKLYGTTEAAKFGPLALRSVRDEMIRSGLARKKKREPLARNTVNARVHRIRRVFRWAASFELIPGSVVENLDTVESLAIGRSAARETDEVSPVPIEHVDAVLPFLSRPVRAMVQVQLLTGCRVGEVVRMRPRDILSSRMAELPRPPPSPPRFAVGRRDAYGGSRVVEGVENRDDAVTPSDRHRSPLWADVGQVRSPLLSWPYHASPLHPEIERTLCAFVE